MVTAIAVVVFASVEMKVRSTGLTLVAKLEKDIEDKTTSIAKIRTGRDPKNPSSVSPSFAEIRGQNDLRSDERGTAWFGCRVRGANEITLPPTLMQVEAQIIITGPFVSNESGAETDVAVPELLRGIVYVFEEGNDENVGKFLGRFRVDSVPAPTKFMGDDENEKNGFQVMLITTDPVSDQEIDQILDATKSRWALYLTPPVDRGKGIFDLLADEERQKFPEELVEKFLSRTMPELTEEEKEGQSAEVIATWNEIRAAMDDPESELGRDFAMALDWLYVQRSSLNRLSKDIESDIETYKTAIEKNEIENEKLESDCLLEEKRVAAMKEQRAKTKELLEQYKAEIDQMVLRMEKLQTLGGAYADKISEYQWQVTEKIEGRTASSTQP